MALRNVLEVGPAPLFQNPMRSALSILGIFIGVGSVFGMMAIGEGAKLIIARDIEKIGGVNQVRFSTRYGIWKKDRIIRYTTERYTLKDAKAIEAECPGVLYALPQTPHTHLLVTSRDGRKSEPLLKGITPDYAIALGWEIHAGRFLSTNDIETASQVCVLGVNTANELFGEVPPLGQEVKIRYWRQPPLRLRIVGVMQAKGSSLSTWFSLDNTLCVPVTTLQERIPVFRDISDIDIFFQKDANFDRLIESVKNILRKRHRGKDDFIEYWRAKAALRRLEHFEKVIKIGLTSIASFSLFVGGIGIMNICLVSVGEKTREIGLRKSVGARRADIFCQFLTESVCLCFCGGVLGIVGGWFAAHGMARLAVRIVPIVPEWPVVLSLPWILISVTFSILIGVGFGVYPAVRAARLSPIDALRTEK